MKKQGLLKILLSVMKFSAVQLCLIALFSSVLMANNAKSQDVLNIRVSITMDNTELKAFLLSVENTAKVKFTYSHQMVAVKSKVSIAVHNERLVDVLDRVLKPLNIGYEVYDRQIVLNKTAANGPLSIQPKNQPSNDKTEVATPPITGKIKDAKSQEAIIGASVVIKGTTKGAITDVNGSFSLDANVGDILVVSYVGYTSKEVKITEGGNLDIALEESLALLGEAVVVGSRFTKPRTDVDRPVPIDVINIKELAATGQVDLGQSIHYSAPSFNAVKFGINDLAPLVDPASLRGLSSDQTLVLVNGKRRHKVSFFNVNEGLGRGIVGTDINAIPAMAIKRVEVLRDGAAAQYGSDAIAGVMNFELNNARKGGSAMIYGGQANSDPKYLDGKSLYNGTVADGKSYKAAVNIGLPLGEKGFINTTLSYQHTDSYDRSGTFTSKFYNTTVAVSDSLVKAKNINLDRANLGAPQSDNLGISINAGYDINKSWKLYGFGNYTKKDILAGFFTRAPSNRARAVEAIFPDGYNPEVPSHLKDYSLVVGAKGALANDWNLDISAGQAANRLDLEIRNTVNPSLGSASPTSFKTGATGISQTTFNADLSKSFNKDAYPNLNFATGTELRHESFTQEAGQLESYQDGPVKLQNGSAVDVGSSGREGYRPETAGTWNRFNVGLYAEVESDLSKEFLVGAAVRFENYNDFGSNLSYKFNFRHTFLEKFALRGSVSRGFRAPSMPQVYFSSQSVQFAANGSSIKTFFVPARNTELGTALGVQSLKAETSLDFSGGLTAKLTPNFIITADAYQIIIEDRIAASGNIGTAGKAPFVALGFGAAADAAIIFSNVLSTQTKGFDVVANYNASFGTNQKLTLNAAANVSKTTVLNNKNKALVNTNAELFMTQAQPNSKIILSANYQIQRFNILLRSTRFGEVTDPTALYDIDVNKDGIFKNYTDATTKQAVLEVDAVQQANFSAKWITDVSVGYGILKNLNLSIGVNNVSDIYPDLLLKRQTAGEVIYSRRTNQFGTQGRYMFATLNLTF